MSAAGQLSVTGGATGAAALLAWFGDSVGITFPDPVTVLLAGALWTLALAVSHEGIRGLFSRLWRGQPK